MTWFVYIVRCADGTFYTGVTTDVPRRVAEHNASKAAKYTRARQPVTLVYYEASSSRQSATTREAAIKKLPRKKKLLLIKN